MTTFRRSLQRRLDHQVLRWQARLDGTWADRVLPWLVTAVLFVLLAGVALARARSFETGLDLAIWVQASWYVTSGLDADLTTTGYHVLEPQLAIGMYLVAQLTRWLAPIPTLIVVQSAALALGSVAVWRLGRQICHLRVGAVAAAALAYAAFPAIHQLNLADVHPEALALPALLWGAYTSFAGRWRLAIPLFVAAVSFRSDLGLTVAAIGVALAVSGRGRGGRRLAAAGVAWTVLAHAVIQPLIGDGTWAHAAAFAAYGDTLGGVIWGMLTDPWQVIVDLVVEENAVALVGLLAPVLFLPLLAPRRFLPFLAPIAVVFLADVPVAGLDGAHLLVPAAAGTFVALPFALEKLGRRNIERVTVDRRILAGLAIAALAFYLTESPSSPYAHPWEWGARDEADAGRMAALELVDDTDAVRTGPSLLGELADRRVLRPVPIEAVPPGEVLLSGVDVLVLTPELADMWPRGRADWDRVREELDDQGADSTTLEGGTVVYRVDPD